MGRQLVDSAHSHDASQLLYGSQVRRAAVDRIDDRDERTTVLH